VVQWQQIEMMHGSMASVLVPSRQLPAVLCMRADNRHMLTIMLVSCLLQPGPLPCSQDESGAAEHSGCWGFHGWGQVELQQRSRTAMQQSSHICCSSRKFHMHSINKQDYGASKLVATSAHGDREILAGIISSLLGNHRQFANQGEEWIVVEALVQEWAHGRGDTGLIRWLSLTARLPLRAAVGAVGCPEQKFVLDAKISSKISDLHADRAP
jgi:hypothetical protein